MPDYPYMSEGERLSKYRENYMKSMSKPMTNPQTDINQASELKRNSLNKSDEDVKLEPISNQASEDERTKLALILGYERQEQHSSEKTRWYDLDEYGNPIEVTKKVDKVIDLIRTEKLKLLDRLESKAFYDPSGTSPLINPREIQAERNKLKESKRL